jgi:hypothetical protein
VTRPAIASDDYAPVCFRPLQSRRNQYPKAPLSEPHEETTRGPDGTVPHLLTAADEEKQVADTIIYPHLSSPNNTSLIRLHVE